MKSHRLPAGEHEVSAHDVAAYGDDDRTFPNGINHVENHPVVQQHPNPEMKVGRFIKDVGDAPSVWHGVAPTATRQSVEDEWNRRQKEATMVAGDTTPPHDNPPPVPVFIVNPNTGSEGLNSWTGGNYSVAESTEIAPRDYKRTRLLIRNEDSTNAIRLSKLSNSQSAFGYLVPAGAEIEIYAQDKVYAVSATAGTTVRVSVLAEYGIDGGN